MRSSASSVMPAGSKRMLRVLAHVRRQRHTVLETQADRDREGVHDPGQRRALLRHLDEDLARTPVLVLADGDVSLAVGHSEGEGARLASLGQALSHRTDHDRVVRPVLLLNKRLLEGGDLGCHLSVVGFGVGPWRSGIPTFRNVLLGGRQRLGHLAVVAVDGDGLDPEAPGVDVQLLDVLDGHVLRQVHRVVVDDAVPDEGVCDRDRHVVDLALAGVVDRLDGTEVKAVGEYLVAATAGGRHRGCSPPAPPCRRETHTVRASARKLNSVRNQTPCSLRVLYGTRAYSSAGVIPGTTSAVLCLVGEMAEQQASGAAPPCPPRGTGRSRPDGWA